MNFTTPENKIHQKYNFSSISRRGKTLKNVTGRLFKLRIFKNKSHPSKIQKLVKKLCPWNDKAICSTIWSTYFKKPYGQFGCIKTIRNW